MRKRTQEIIIVAVYGYIKRKKSFTDIDCE